MKIKSSGVVIGVAIFTRLWQKQQIIGSVKIRTSGDFSARFTPLKTAEEMSARYAESPKIPVVIR